MFKIMLNGMWSKDYLKSLAEVLSIHVPCDIDEAFVKIRELTQGKRMSVVAHTPSKAHDLACDLLQYGCYTEVEQVGPLTDAAMIADLEGWFDDDQSTFRVVTNAAGQVTRIIEEQGYAFLRMETQVLNDWVGEELIRLGAQQVDESDWPALNQRLQTAIAENEVRRMDLRAERAANKLKYGHIWGEWIEEE